MAEEISHQSGYVKLRKEQAPAEDINPGELNLPIDVPQLHAPKCRECGQPLPESYQAPADEPWTSGIFECAQDPESCRTGLFCPCILFGRNIEQLREDTPWTGPCICHAIFVEGGLALAVGTAALNGLIVPGTISLITEGLFCSWMMCGMYTSLVRLSLQKKYHLKNSPCDPLMVHCCLHWCAICQEHRELKGRLSDDTPMPMTVVNPPPVQEMNASGDSHHSTLPPRGTANGGEQVNAEMQAL
ncbi:PLAC8 family protein [Striga hermonthica]|uniref:PLAC8 family protein n=1 Tax=Striga hermonthica TaxID=68872 RepID=A0A9N7NTJ9_STRHE|nr:PLAC8 family protein [Striga hermonthica]